MAYDIFMIMIITYNKADNNFNLLTLKSGHENHFVSEICGVVYLKRNAVCVMRVMVIRCGSRGRDLSSFQLSLF